MELEEAIKGRKSIRHYVDLPISNEDIEKLIWAGSKVPSAGGCHPLRFYIIKDKEAKDRLCHAALNQNCISEAYAVIIICADYSKIVKRYHRRGYRYTFMEAGHVGQNISLMAVQLGLGCVMIGAFRDADVKEVLGIEEDPLYLIPIGRI